VGVPLEDTGLSNFSHISALLSTSVDEGLEGGVHLGDRILQPLTTKVCLVFRTLDVRGGNAKSYDAFAATFEENDEALVGHAGIEFRKS
jgi:hypothetical protein